MVKDPINMQGPCIIKEGIAHDTGENISWYVTNIVSIYIN
jgi:hypothetical protein